MEEKKIVYSSGKDLGKIALCHIKSFPNSLSSCLGLSYCIKMFEWYHVSPNRFLFHLEHNNQIIAYCGGFVKSGELHGSSTGMTQHAFKNGVYSLIRRPWLFLHPHFLKNYKFLLRNLIIRIKTRNRLPNHTNNNKSLSKKLTAGLVVIGVDPEYRGKRYSSVLIKEFERKAVEMDCNKVILTVESENNRAIMAYKRNGWVEGESNQNSLTMYKLFGE